MADSNPANFANLDKETVRETASLGGKASHRSKKDTKENETTVGLPAAEDPGRNADGTFKLGSETAKELGKIGGKLSHENDEKDTEDSGRYPDGTFKPGSEAAKIAGQKGGLAAAEAED